MCSTDTDTKTINKLCKIPNIIKNDSFVNDNIIIDIVNVLIAYRLNIDNVCYDSYGNRHIACIISRICN